VKRRRASVRDIARPAPWLQLMKLSRLPGPDVLAAAVVGAPMGHRRFDCRAQRLQVVGQVGSCKAGPHRRHPASDVNPDRGGDNRAPGWNHGADGRADTHVNVGHRGDPAEDKRQRRGITQLLLRLRFEGDALNPGPNRHALFGCQFDVVLVRDICFHG